MRKDLSQVTKNAKLSIGIIHDSIDQEAADALALHVKLFKRMIEQTTQAEIVVVAVDQNTQAVERIRGEIKAALTGEKADIVWFLIHIVTANLANTMGTTTADFWGIDPQQEAKARESGRVHHHLSVHTEGSQKAVEALGLKGIQPVTRTPASRKNFSDAHGAEAAEGIYTALLLPYLDYISGKTR